MNTSAWPGEMLDIGGGLDVIGDLHGHAAALLRMLEALGYRKVGGRWMHPGGRRAFFVGDLIDRGPQQVLTVQIVRELVEGGMAGIVMGNHEFNAIAWATPDPDHSGEHLRGRTGEDGARHRRQHEAFLAEVGEGSPTHVELIRWFRTLPLWCDLGRVRVVHACWDPVSIERLAPRLDSGNRLTSDTLVTTNRAGDADHDAVEVLLKGPELLLPDGLSYLDKDGHERHEARFAWWDRHATTYRRGAVIPPGARAGNGGPFPVLPDRAIERLPAEPYTDDVPVFVGHYWRSGTPAVHTPTVTCVDYSVAAGGPLAAYRWDEEEQLDDAKFITV